MKENKKEEINKFIYIIIVFSLCCGMIYFRDNFLSVVFTLINILFVFVFNRVNKKYHFFVFLLLSCLFIPINEVKAESFNPSFTFSKAKRALNNFMVEQGANLNEYSKYFYYYKRNGAPCYEYMIMAYKDIEYIYEWKYNRFHPYTREDSYIFQFNSGVTFDEVGNPIGTTETRYCSSLVDSTEYFLGIGVGGYIDIDLSSSWHNDFKVLYAEEDIVFKRDTLASSEKVFLYKKEESSVYEEFGYDLGAVEGYKYISISPKNQVVLYPKTLQPFDFYLFHNGHLAVDILDSVASNIGDSIHYSNVLANSYIYQKIPYSQDDADNKRGVYLSNFSDTPVIVGYNPNLFTLLNFNENGLAITEDGTMTFTNTYSVIKNQNNIVDSDDKLGSFDNLISNPKNLITGLTNAFKSFGQLITMFFNSMPSFIVQGLQLLFVIIIVIAILKALL